MHPDIVTIGPFTVHSYGLMIVVGFIAATWLAMRRAPRFDITPTHMFDVAYWVLLSSMGGAKLFYIIVNWREFSRDLSLLPESPMDFLRTQGGGFIFFGGLAGAFVAGIVFARRHNIPFWQLADLSAPSIALGHCLGRIGCFLAGCCHGKACAAPWAITFHDPNSLAPHNIALHPTQLYSAASLLILAGVLIWLTRYRRFPGQIFLGYVILYSIIRFIIEFFRGDERGFLPGTPLSTSQAFALVAFAAASAAMVIMWKKART